MQDKRTIDATVAASGINAEIMKAERLYHQSVLYGDRFDGTPNFDDARGARDAMYRLAAYLGLDVIPADALERWALKVFEDENPEDEDVLEYVAVVRSGAEWDRC